MSATMPKAGRMSPLLDGEKILHEQKSFRLISSRCSPGYSINLNVPFFMSSRLLVTNRRCLVVFRLFIFMIQEISMWYPGKNPENDLETITNVRCDKGFFGNFLETVSLDPARGGKWYWNEKLTMRFYFKNPERLETLIRHEMEGKELRS